MPTPVARTFLGIGAITAALMLGGLGVGIAVAEPGEDPGNVTETEPGDDSGNVVIPEPTPTPTAVPRTLSGQLRDMLRRPLSVFGNGRRPGQPAGGASSSAPATETTAPRKPKRRLPEPAPEAPVPEPVPERPVAPKLPEPLPYSTAEVRLPFLPSITVPVLTPPGTGARTYALDATSPAAAYDSVDQTFATFNSLIEDVYAPFDPFPDPPAPGPAFRTLEEEPVLDAMTGGGGGAVPMSGPAGVGAPLPALQMPVLAPGLAPRVPAPLAQAPSLPEVLGGGTGGPPPALRGPALASPAERVAPSGAPAAQGGSGLRQGYPQYLRSARVGEVALVALPGLAGLLAITASGGVIGYRQADSLRHLRDGADRYLN